MMLDNAFVTDPGMLRVMIVPRFRGQMLYPEAVSVRERNPEQP